MSIQTCPTTMVAAPADRVWRLLTTPRELQRWSGLRIVNGPDRPLATGDEVVFRAGSELESIQGAGKRTVQKLLKEFGSSELVRAATEEQLAVVVGRAAARRVKSHYLEAPQASVRK